MNHNDKKHSVYQKIDVIKPLVKIRQTIGDRTQVR